MRPPLKFKQSGLALLYPTIYSLYNCTNFYFITIHLMVVIWEKTEFWSGKYSQIQNTGQSDINTYNTTNKIHSLNVVTGKLLPPQE